MKYGQQTFVNEAIGDFEGDLDSAAKIQDFFEHLFLKAKKLVSI